MAEQSISDDEVLYRRIPPGESWFQQPDRVTSGNFKIRTNEIGLSVYREIKIDRNAILNHPKAVLGSRLTRATAKEIRELTNAKGELLSLDIFAVNDGDDPGHAEIRLTIPGNFNKGGIPDALRRIFRLV